jgi:hypothetical protein
MIVIIGLLSFSMFVICVFMNWHHQHSKFLEEIGDQSYKLCSALVVGAFLPIFIEIFQNEICPFSKITRALSKHTLKIIRNKEKYECISLFGLIIVGPCVIYFTFGFLNGFEQFLPYILLIRYMLLNIL